MNNIRNLAMLMLLLFLAIPILAIDIPTPSPPKDPYAGLSPLELSKKADEAYASSQFGEAEKIYTALLKAIPDDPVAKQRLQELKDRRQQAEAEEKIKAEMVEKLKNADFYMARGDEAYKTGDFATAASYYIKVSEVDETYQHSGVKYWLSKGMVANANSDGNSLNDAINKLKKLTPPDALIGAVSSLDGMAVKFKPPENSTMEVVLEARSCIDYFQLMVDGKVFWKSSLSTWVGKKSSASKTFSISPGKHEIILTGKMLSATEPFRIKVDYSTPGNGHDTLRFNFPFLGGVKMDLNGKPI